ncbi:hypothetical protein EB001_23530 [bacterium]|nr:hypothetical protein [bacterium]
MSVPPARILVLDNKERLDKMTNTKENVKLNNGYYGFDHEQYHYNDYNVKGNNPNCKHPTYTEVRSSTSVNKYCTECGYRRLFILYAKYRKKR